MIPRRRFLALAATSFAVAGLPAAAASRHQWQGQALGSDVALTVSGGTERDARAFFAEAARTLRMIEGQFSLFRGSELARLNSLGRLPHPSEHMQTLLALAGEVHQATGGAFDPTIQPLWQARRHGLAETEAAALAGWGDVDLLPDEIRLKRHGMALTLNGIAQGYAADRLSEVAAKHGLTDVLVDTGEVRASGVTEWSARVDSPTGRIGELTLRDRALATSAAYGTRIGPQGDQPHILSAGRAVPQWQLVSISLPSGPHSAALADALSTAAILMPRDSLENALARFPGARIEAAVAL